MAGGGQGVAAAGDHQIVLGHHAMTGLGIDGQTAGAVQGQIGFDEDDRVNVVVIYGHVLPAVGQLVLGALRQGDKHFIRLQRIDGGGGAAGDIRPRKDQLHLIRFTCVDHNLAVGEGAGK